MFKFFNNFKYLKHSLLIAGSIALCALPANRSHAQFTHVATTTIPHFMTEVAAMANGISITVGTEIAYQMTAQKVFWMTFWKLAMLPQLKSMTDQLGASSMFQAYAIGTFFDAKTQLETQQLLQKIHARANKDYHPSTGMCRFGSATKSLAASERKGDLTALTLRRYSQDRSLGNVSALSSLGASKDLDARVAQFKRTYCDASDNNGALAAMCKVGDMIGGQDPRRINRDIDYARTIGMPWTLNMDFSDKVAQADEQDVMALATNLYGGNQIALAGETDALKDSLGSAAQNYMDARANIAKRSVAENSFFALAAMKSQGEATSKNYINAIMKELGIAKDDQLKALLGDKPSYYAQMEVLTKKIYQSPNFYTNLYDKPANVARKKVAMQAIGLMQKFDMLKSQLRAEANAALLLEMAVSREQNGFVGLRQ